MTVDSLLNRAFDKLYKPLVVVAVILLAAQLARRPSPFLLLLFVAGLGGLLLLRRPELGLVGVLVSALIVPFSIATGTYTSLHAAVLLIPLLVAVWLLDMVRRRDVRLVPSPTNAPLIIFCLVAILAFVAGNLPWNYFASTAPMPAQLGGLAVFLLSAAAFLLAGNQITDLRWLERLTWLFIVLGGLYVAGRLLPPLGAVVFRFYQYGATGSLFWVWLVALAGGQALFNRSLGQRWRAALMLLVIVTLAIGWQNRGWASGWLPEAVALLALLWLYSPRVGLAATCLGAGYVFFIRPELPPDLVAGDQYSIFTRRVAWQIILGQVLPNNPLLGLGPANYYHYTPLYPILGWYVRFNSHNQYVDIIAQTGLLGIAAFVWLMAAIARLGWHLRQEAAEGFPRAYVCACLAGLAGSLAAGMLADWFLPFVYNIGFAGFRASMLGWMWLGGMVAVRKMAHRGNTFSSSEH